MIRRLPVMAQPVVVRAMTADDAAAVLRIYQAGLDGGDASFESVAPRWDAFDGARLPGHRFVAVTAGAVTAGAVNAGAVNAGPVNAGAVNAGAVNAGAVNAGAVNAGAVVGWVAVSPVSTRAAYAGVVEHSVYVDPAVQGRGVGRRLLEALVASTEAAGIWTVQSGVFPENVASLRLHRRAGFQVVGTRHHPGRHQGGRYAGRWRDVVLVERRSPTVYP